MKKETDIYLKDEGDFFTVILMTDKAREVMDGFGDQWFWKEDKINMNKTKSNSNAIVSWAISHGLSIDSELNIIV